MEGRVVHEYGRNDFKGVPHDKDILELIGCVNHGVNSHKFHENNIDNLTGKFLSDTCIMSKLELNMQFHDIEGSTHMMSPMLPYVYLTFTSRTFEYFILKQGSSL